MATWLALFKKDFRLTRVLDIGVHRHVIFGEVVVHEAAEACDPERLLVQRHADAHTTPPRTWLVAVMGLMMRAAATAWTSASPGRRGARRRPCTSAKIAVRVYFTYLLPAGLPGLRRLLAPERGWRTLASRASDPQRPGRGVRRSPVMRAVDELDVLDVSTSPSGNLRFCAGSRISSPTALAGGCNRARPTLAAVIEPPCTGARAASCRRARTYLLDRQAERVGRDLRHDRVGAGADVLRAGLHERACRRACSARDAPTLAARAPDTSRSPCPSRSARRRRASSAAPACAATSRTARRACA